MKIWLINNYTMLPEHGPMTRQYYFAKELSARGHEVTVFAGSHIHNSDIQLVEGERWKIWQEQPFRWVYVHTLAYGKSRKKQVLSMFQFYRNTAIAAQYFRKQYGTPDVILGSSAHPLTALLAVRLGQKYHCKSIAEIRDLWPESIVAYGIAGPHNPAVLALRRLEKWIYKKADALIFTMEGAYDYIVEQGWEKEIPRAKVHYINNGVDLEQFDYNKEHFRVEDADLDEPDTYKIIYVGSLRKANDQIFLLMDAFGLMQGDEFQNYRFLIYGKGELQHQLQEICEQRHYTNVRFKGFIEKKYIPYILSRCDLNVLNCASNPILRYGGSQNKLFDYLASGHPVLSGENGRYSVVAREGCGICREMSSPEAVVAAIREIQQEQPSAEHIRKVAEQYDFKTLTKKLLAIIEGREYV